MSKLFCRWVRNQSGATAIEYGLMLAGISIVIVATVFMVGDDVAGLFENIRGWIGSR